MNPSLEFFLREKEGIPHFTVTGLPFTWALRKNGLYISRVQDNGDCTFTYENLEKALSQMPVHTVAGLKAVRGPSYCLAILWAFEHWQQHQAAGV